MENKWTVDTIVVYNWFHNSTPKWLHEDEIVLNSAQLPQEEFRQATYFFEKNPCISHNPLLTFMTEQYKRNQTTTTQETTTSFLMHLVTENVY